MHDRVDRVVAERRAQMIGKAAGIAVDAGSEYDIGGDAGVEPDGLLRRGSERRARRRIVSSSAGAAGLAIRVAT